MTFYSNLAATALRLITAKGSAWVLSHTTNGEYDPAVLGTQDNVTATETVQGVLGDYNERAIDGTLVQAGDKSLMIAAHGMTYEPQVGDKITKDSVDWRIEHVGIMKPADTVLYYTLRVRR